MARTNHTAATVALAASAGALILVSGSCPAQAQVRRGTGWAAGGHDRGYAPAYRHGGGRGYRPGYGYGGGYRGPYGPRYGYPYGSGYGWGYGAPYWGGYYAPWWWGGYGYYGAWRPTYAAPPVYYEAPPPPRPTAPAPAPAAPAPAAPAAEPEQFIVYFPFDQDVITPQARDIIHSAAEYQRRVGGQVSVVGHTDTSGSFAYNEALSERRSRAVREALAGEGVDRGRVAMDWKGEREPAVHTGDHAKESRNRRVTILVQRPS
jgi:outer membrane protein OmpA-like peptidoglycan-associated protein